MGNLKLYRNKAGQKLYPVCSWEKNQHKLYNAHDRLMVAFHDDKVEWEEIEKVEKAMSAFDSHVVGDLVYATWEDSKLIKDYIFAYNARH